MKRKIKYKKGDTIEVVFTEPSSFIKVGTKGTVVSYFELNDVYEIDWGNGWVGYMPKEHIHRVGDPEIFEKIEIKITPKGDHFKGVMKFKHRNVIKTITEENSCEYSVCKNLISKFKHDPLKYCN